MLLAFFFVLSCPFHVGLYHQPEGLRGTRFPSKRAGGRGVGGCRLVSLPAVVNSFTLSFLNFPCSCFLFSPCRTGLDFTTCGSSWDQDHQEEGWEEGGGCRLVS